MTKLYEGMFLLDNQVVRADWGRAKSAVTDTLTKYGASVQSARRWDERRLAYPIRGRRRATYLLTYFEIGPDGVNNMRRDLELDERVLRYLIVSTDAVPSGEREQTQAELAADFSVPTPPEDEVATREQTEFGHLGEGRGGRDSEPEAAVVEEAPGADAATDDTAVGEASAKPEEKS